MDIILRKEGLIMMERKRILSLILCAALMVGLLPTGVWAVDDAQDVTITETVSDKKTVYVLTSTIEAGKQYLIVNGNSAGTGYHALTNNSGSIADTTVTIQNGITATGNQQYIELDDATSAKTLWSFSPNASNASFWDVSNNDKYLGHSVGDWGIDHTLTLDNTSESWSAEGDTLYYTYNVYSDFNIEYYLTYSNAWTVESNWDGENNVYFYTPTTATITTETSTTYSMRAADMTKVLDGSGLIEPLDFCLQVDGTDLSTSELPANGQYTFSVVGGDTNIINSIAADGKITFTGEAGSATVKVAYTWTDDNGSHTAYKNVTVTAELPNYSLELCRPYDTDNDGVYDDFNPITKPIVVKGVKEDQLSTELIWAVVKMNDENLGDLDDDALVWVSSDPTIATVDTHTGQVIFTGAEGLVTITCSYEYAPGKAVTDMVVFSVSKGNYIVPGDGTDDFPIYPNEGAVRFDKHASAVGSFNQTGIVKMELSMTGVPYSKGSEIDVVIMMDMSSSMDDDQIEASQEAANAAIEAIVINEDGSINNNRVAVYSFNGWRDNNYNSVIEQTYTDSSNTISIKQLCELKSFRNNEDIYDKTSLTNTQSIINSNDTTGSGTNYAVALKQCWQTLNNARDADNNYNRKQFVIFLTDGAASTGFAYVNDTGGKTVLNNGKLGDQGDAMLDELVGYDEYYSRQMKDSGVEVYTIGLHISNEYAKTVLKNIAGTKDGDGSDDGYEKYAHNVATTDDPSNLKDIFKTIANEIKQAATNVAVEDKMGEGFTMVFDAPNSKVAQNDGGQEYYIEVGEYALNPVTDDAGNITDYTRGNFTSFMKLYMGIENGNTYYAATAKDSEDGANKYATPAFATVTEGVKGYWTKTLADGTISVTGTDGTYYFVSDGTGTHNMISGAYAHGTITTETIVSTDADGNTSTSTNQLCKDLIIATPYFVYNAADRTLVWTAEKLSTTELVLNYFLYLENSAGYEKAAEQIAAGTYQTNEYADFTYTNFQDNPVQQEFPAPQVTWNGAQVSYVFYLVNEQGQPVNRAGRVVPFSEAVYVTDVITQSITWNDLEQLESLDSSLIADNLLPDVYDLFDPAAKYTIHVFEDEARQNLNNHFKIEGTNGIVNTTYVFNSKSDAKKYSTPGTYAAAENFYCKDYNVTKDGDSYTYTGTAEQYRDSSGNPVYDVDDIGPYTIATTETQNVVNSGFDFANTTVAFAVRWMPKLIADAVVIDYGLEVSIDVTTNDLSTGRAVGLLTQKPKDVNGVDVEMNTGTVDNLTFETETKIYLDGQEIGIATISGSNVVFALNKQNGMQLTKPIVFYYVYEVQYYENNNVQEMVTKYMYSSVTIIPASTVYYEENFVQTERPGEGTVTVTKATDGTITSASYTPAENEIQYKIDKAEAEKMGAVYYDTTNQYAYFIEDGEYYTLVSFEATWFSVGDVTGTWQDTDRPGNSILAGIDANSLYGYDTHYLDNYEYSNGAAKKVTVNADTFATATFTFTGTGFDLIGLTSDKTGTVRVEMKDSQGNAVLKDTSDHELSYFVDTYYGYAYNADTGEWTAQSQNPDTIWQVPVLTVRDLNYDTYTVTIYVSYNIEHDHQAVKDENADNSYDFYLDAVRIYDPTGVVCGAQTISTVTNAYVADNEWNPDYEELGNELLTMYGKYDMLSDGKVYFTDGITDDTKFDSSDSDGFTAAVFIDGNEQTTSVLDYAIYGPNNEVYLAPGQSIAIKVDDTYENNVKANLGGITVADVQLGFKVANGGTVSVNIGNYKEATVNGVKTYTLMASSSETMSLNTATDMYYSILDHFHDVIVIQNTGSGILSLTNIKATFTPAPVSQVEEGTNSETNNDTTTQTTTSGFQVVLDFFYYCFFAAVVAVADATNAISSWLNGLFT